MLAAEALEQVVQTLRDRRVIDDQSYRPLVKVSGATAFRQLAAPQLGPAVRRSDEFDPAGSIDGCSLAGVHAPRPRAELGVPLTWRLACWRLRCVIIARLVEEGIAIDDDLEQVSRGTIYRWLKAYLEGRLEALEPRKRKVQILFLHPHFRQE